MPFHDLRLPSRPSPLRSMEAPRILIVEDDAVTATDLRSTLEDLGYEVPAVLCSPDGAIQAARNGRVDLALVDVRLAGSMKGAELGKALASEVGIPIVYLTAMGDRATLDRIRHWGASGYLLKPFRPQELRAVITLALDAHRVRERLQSSEERYRILFQENVAGVLRKSEDGTILECNEAFCEILGYDSPTELVGRPAEILYPEPEDREHFLEELHGNGKVRNLELRMRRRDGTPVWVLDNATLVREPESDSRVVLSTVLEISERKSLESSLKKLAYHDPLTGLPNRRHLEEKAPQILALADRREGRLALFFLDLVGFKQVNDTWGHRTGDRVLVEVGHRLTDELRAADAVARVGGDEFAVLLAEVDDIPGVRKAARRLIERLEEPMEVNGIEVRVGARLGVALFPEHGEELEELLIRADRAVAQAKGQGGSAVVVAPGDLDQLGIW